jgi:glycosyltransferase involved in cell wall biosynthesis
VCIVGSQEHPDKLIGGYAEWGKKPGVTFCGPQSESELQRLYARASAYAATSCYEPFGLALVEAALSRCALVTNDLPVFHELWGDTACYFRKNEANSLADAIAFVTTNADRRSDYAQRAYTRAMERFTADRMIAEYERLYGKLVLQEVAA